MKAEKGYRTNIFFWSVLLLWSRYSSHAFSLDLRKRIPGIWKLQIVESVVDRQPIIDALLKGIAEADETECREALIKLQNDGSFRQCDEGYQEGRWMSGRFNLTENTLRLAMDRQYYGPPHDTLLSGEIVSEVEGDEQENEKDKQEDKQDSGSTTDPQRTLSVSGSVTTGMFGLPKKDPTFFEKIGLTKETTIGSFELKQVLSFEGVLPGVHQQDEGIDSTSLADEQPEDRGDSFCGSAFQ